MKTLTQELTDFCKEHDIPTEKVKHLLKLVLSHKDSDTISYSNKSIDDYEFNLHSHWKEDLSDNESSGSIDGIEDY